MSGRELQSWPGDIDPGAGHDAPDFGDDLIVRGDFARHVEDMRAIGLAQQRGFVGGGDVIDIDKAGRTRIRDGIGLAVRGGAAGQRRARRSGRWSRPGPYTT